MKIKLLIPALALIVLSAISALAQVGRLEGEVKKRGTGEPIANAEIQIHREDIKWSSTLKTDKKGKFVHAGIQYGGRYTVIISAEGYSPAFSSGHKPDQPALTFELDPGDGKKLTFEEVKNFKPGGGGAPAASGGGAAKNNSAPPAAANPAASKKAEEEYKKKVDEINKKNEKIKSDNAAMQKALDEGKTLFNNKDYNGAIAEFDKGLTLDAEQHVFWYFKGLALYNRGVTKLNESLKDPALRDPAKTDFTDAITNATKAVTLLETQAGADPAKAAQVKGTKAPYLKVKADSESLLGKRFGDQAMAEASNKDYVACAELIDDPAEKKKRLFAGAETLREAGMTEPAVTAYKAILDADAGFVDAYYGIGLAYAGNEKTFQDAANYLQLFVDKAPNDPRAAESKQVIEALKVGNNIKPSKDAMKILQKEGGGAEKGKAPAKKKN